MNKIKGKKISGLPQVRDCVTVFIGNWRTAGAQGLGNGESEDSPAFHTHHGHLPRAPGRLWTQSSRC